MRLSPKNNETRLNKVYISETRPRQEAKISSKQDNNFGFFIQTERRLSVSAPLIFHQDKTWSLILYESLCMCLSACHKIVRFSVSPLCAFLLPLFVCPPPPLVHVPAPLVHVFVPPCLVMAKIFLRLLQAKSLHGEVLWAWAPTANML